jgi:hypothetical protein
MLYCTHCTESVLPTERLFEYANGPVAHYACFLRQVVGSVAHQQHRCACYGGGQREGDDPTLSPRQAAEAAVAYYYGGDGGVHGAS